MCRSKRKRSGPLSGSTASRELTRVSGADPDTPCSSACPAGRLPQRHTWGQMVSEHWLGKSRKTQMRSGKVGQTGGGQQASHLGRPHARYLWLPVTPQALSCVGQGGLMDPPHQCHQSWMRSVLGSSPWPHVGWRAPEAWGQAYQGDVGASCGSIRSACGVTGPGVWETVALLTVCRASPRCRPCGWGCGWRHPPQYPLRVASVPSPACCLMSPRSHSERAALLCVVTVTLVAL